MDSKEILNFKEHYGIIDEGDIVDEEDLEGGDSVEEE